MLKGGNFDRQISIDSYLLNFSSNFIKMVTFKSRKPGPFNCETIISVGLILIELEHSKDSLHAASFDKTTGLRSKR